ncbi:MAG: hypothetical protein NYU05_01475 [Aigarchaeota archaeon]|jgi:hypothetical protein|nr:hypothetical protein [Candidatus Caldarchaeales archaeon]
MSNNTHFSEALDCFADLFIAVICNRVLIQTPFPNYRGKVPEGAKAGVFFEKSLPHDDFHGVELRQHIPAVNSCSPLIMDLDWNGLRIPVRVLDRELGAHVLDHSALHIYDNSGAWTRQDGADRESREYSGVRAD